MMSEQRDGKKWARKAREVGSVSLTVTSLSDRLAHMSVLAGIKVSLCCWIFCAHVFIWQGLPPVSRPTMPQGKAWRIAPPSTRRFLECSDDDLKIGEVVELLKEYRRLVEDVRMAGLGVFGGCVS